MARDAAMSMADQFALLQWGDRQDRSGFDQTLLHNGSTQTCGFV